MHHLDQATPRQDPPIAPQQGNVSIVNSLIANSTAMHAPAMRAPEMTKNERLTIEEMTKSFRQFSHVMATKQSKSLFLSVHSIGMM
jgi:hypothetical protein